MRRLTSSAAVVAGALLIACSAAGAATAKPSATKRLESILSAAHAQRSVHYTTSMSHAGGTWVDFTGDAGRSIGVQHATFHKDGQVGHVTVIATAAAAYVRGDAFTLANFVELPPPLAERYANRWLVVPKAAGAYASVAADVMLGSAIDDLRPRGSLATAAAGRLHGRDVIAVSGSSATKGRPKLQTTLYASATGAPLPAAEVQVQGSVRDRFTLSNWNEQLHIAIPKGAAAVAGAATI